MDIRLTGGRRRQCHYGEDCKFIHRRIELLLDISTVERSLVPVLPKISKTDMANVRYIFKTSNPFLSCGKEHR